MRMPRRLAVAGLLALVSPLAHAAEPALVVSEGPASRTYSVSALLARPDVSTIVVPNDVAYNRPMTYRAVPLLALLGDGFDTRFDTVEAAATDGFVSQIPLKLVAGGASGGAVAWIAVEDPQRPWPTLARLTSSAGPFYLVWDHPERSDVRPEQWPYAVARIALVESPVHRWPRLALPAARQNDPQLQHGRDVFITQCFPCHRLYGAGQGQMGPDLGLPQNATRYLTDAGLRAIIRNPRAVRVWPTQLMQGFDQAALPDAELGAIVAYLHAMADKP